MFNFMNFGTPYMSGSQTSRNSYRPTQRRYDPWDPFQAQPEPAYYYEPRRSVYNTRTPYYQDEYIPMGTPVRNSRPSYDVYGRPMNQSMVYEQPRRSQVINEPRRPQRQQQQQPRVSKQANQGRPTTKAPQNTNAGTRRPGGSVSQNDSDFWNMFSRDPFFGGSHAPVSRTEVSDDDDNGYEDVVGSSHTPVETMRKEPMNTQRPQPAKTNINNKENQSKAANNMKREQQQQEAKPKTAQKAAEQTPEKVKPKIIHISPSKDPQDLVTIEDETPVQQRPVEADQPRRGIIEEVNPQQE